MAERYWRIASDAIDLVSHVVYGCRCFVGGRIFGYTVSFGKITWDYELRMFRDHVIFANSWVVDMLEILGII